MANFLEELWNSVFTAGPTPTLLVATNATFAALQLILLLLLVATYSVHFFVLSFISAGLWWAINWFASELEAAGAEQQQQKIELDERKTQDATDELDAADDTETEMASSSFVSKKAVAASSSRLAPDMSVRKRRSLAESTGDVSTDSEWEKVSESDK